MDEGKPGRTPAWAKVIGTVLVVLYPLFVYLGLTAWGTRVVALALLGLLVPGVLLRGLGQTSGFLATVRPLVPAALLIGGSIAIDDARLLLVMPVLISGSLLLGFASTLRPGRTPMVERFARMHEPELPVGGEAYCRSVTKVWCAFFVINTTIAAVLAFRAPVSWWAAYTGAIAYGLIGLIFTVEYVVRKARFRRYGSGPHDRLLALLFPPQSDTPPP